ncbi:unnamed protein product [Ranitomeya imitator]|uniref:Sodefrin-like factor n=1 Tax=Ranitomeya imitator TaxID=111125 RepID=A0ABN9L875_9NEOB|nr:unnamed protein product [Ranitomeya imitator]
MIKVLHKFIHGKQYSVKTCFFLLSFSSSALVPSRNSTQNGLVCRTCTSPDSTWCYTSDTMQCTGDEDMCILQTTKITDCGSLVEEVMALVGHCQLVMMVVVVEHQVVVGKAI